MNNYQTNPQKPTNYKRYMLVCTIVTISICVTVVGIATAILCVYFSIISGNPIRNIYNITYDGRHEETAQYVGDMMGANVVEIIAGKSAGSGFIVTADDGGVIMITNHHVIQESKNSIYYRTVYQDDGYFTGCTLLGYDEYHDIAVLRAANVYKQNSFVDLMDASGAGFEKGSFFASADLGEYLIAIGNALNEGLGMVDGICSKASTVIKAPTNKYATVIQTTAAINEGMSGGPVFNKYGQVVGVGTYKSVEGDDMNYAVPIDIALAVYDDIMAGNMNSAKQVTLLSQTNTKYTTSITYTAYSSFSSASFFTVNVLGEPNTGLTGAKLLDGMGFSGILLSGSGDECKGITSAEVYTGLKVTASKVNGLASGDIITKIGDQSVTCKYGDLFAALYKGELAQTTYDETSAITLTLSSGKVVDWKSSTYWIRKK